MPEVIDVWYDSGAMPFAQFGAPLRNNEEFERSYPAQFICEAIDQTRGWFYSLMAVGTLVFGRSAYQNVVCMGLLVDERGRKMSKHLGNVLEPMQLMEAHGADAVRWFFAVTGSPWATRKIGPGILDEIVRKVLLTYWNTASFLLLYANAAATSGAAADAGAGWLTPALASRPAARRPAAAGPLAAQRAERGGAGGHCGAGGVRHRSGRAGGSPDSSTTCPTGTCAGRGGGSGPGRRPRTARPPLPRWRSALDTLTRLMAPITPFITDYVWSVLRDDGRARRRCTWRHGQSSTSRSSTTELAGQMALVRRLVELGRSARASAVVKIRQPLGRALIAAPGFAALPAELRAQVAEELNVRDDRAARRFRRRARAATP